MLQRPLTNVDERGPAARRRGLPRSARSGVVVGTLSLAGLTFAAVGPAMLAGEPGEKGPGPDPATYYESAEALAKLPSDQSLVTEALAEELFARPEDLPDLAGAVLLAEAPDLTPFVTEAELAAGYVEAGGLPDLAPYLSKGEAAALYLPKAAVPAQESLATAADLPDLSPYVTKAELGAQYLSHAALDAGFYTQAAAGAAFVAKDAPLPPAIVAQVKALIEQSLAAQTCPSGMVPVADFCIDEVEASIWTKPCVATFAPAGAVQRGADSDDFGPTFPDSGSFTKEVWACPVKGVKPSRFVTWFQAQQACAVSGKRLCTDAEWQLAALGTGEKGCAVATADVQPTGASSDCRSDFQVFDMVGNVREIVAEWHQAGKPWKNMNGEVHPAWPLGYGDGQDVVRNVDGRTVEPATISMPAMVLRGGSHADGSGAGAYALAVSAAPIHTDGKTGFRCCRSRR